MSVKKKAMKLYGYTENPDIPICKNCIQFSSEKRPPAWSHMNREEWISRHGEGSLVEAGMHCMAHNHSVKKTASCREFVKKSNVNQI